MDRASCACACPMHGHGHGSSRHTAYCTTSSAISPTNPTTTPPLCDLVRRCLRLRRLPCTRRRARRGVDHNGQADLDCERWFYTDAGLLKLHSRDIPLAHPDEAVKVVKKSKPSGLHHVSSTTFIIAVQDRRGATARAGEAGAKDTLSAARVLTRTPALLLPTHFISTITHA
jgi:hypothetical protein